MFGAIKTEVTMRLPSLAFLPIPFVSLPSNVPSKLRGCSAAQLVRKRRAAVSNCRAANRDHYVNFIYLLSL